MSASTSGVAPMYPINPARMTSDPGHATIDQSRLRPSIPMAFWTGVQPGAVTTAANTPAGPAPAAPAPAAIPGAAPASGGSCCGS